MKYSEIVKMRNEFDDLIKDLKEENTPRILEIIKYIGEVDSDDEVAHSMEDKFREACLKAIDHPLAIAALKTSEFDFSRWCA